MLACKSGDEKKCNPNPKNMSELIVFNTNEELEKYSKELEKYGLRKEYRLDSQERIDKNYKNAKEYFYRMNPKEIKVFENGEFKGFSGKIKINGRDVKITVRNNSKSTKSPTIDIWVSKSKHIEIRF